MFPALQLGRAIAESAQKISTETFGAKALDLLLYLHASDPACAFVSVQGIDSNMHAMLGAAAKLGLALHACTADGNGGCPSINQGLHAAAGTRMLCGTWCASRQSTCAAAMQT